MPYPAASARSFSQVASSIVDAVLAALLLAQILDLARIEHARAAFRRRRRFQIAREFGDFLFEILQGPERRDVEYRHETAVVVPAGRLDAKAQAREQAAQHLDHRGKAAALVALAAAERQQRAALAVFAWDRWCAGLRRR